MPCSDPSFPLMHLLECWPRPGIPFQLFPLLVSATDAAVLPSFCWVQFDHFGLSYKTLEVFIQCLRNFKSDPAMSYAVHVLKFRLGNEHIFLFYFTYHLSLSFNFTFCCLVMVDIPFQTVSSALKAHLKSDYIFSPKKKYWHRLKSMVFMYECHIYTSNMKIYWLAKSMCLT